MKTVATEIANVDIDSLARELSAARIALADAERAVERDEKRAESSRNEAAKRRLEIGRLLISVRKNWPTRGPNAKGWSDFLLKAGIDDASARRWMEYAGYIGGEFSLTEKNVSEKMPTLRDAGLDNRQRKSEIADIVSSAAERFDARPIQRASVEARAELAQHKPLASVADDLESALDEVIEAGLDHVGDVIRKAIAAIRAAQQFN